MAMMSDGLLLWTALKPCMLPKLCCFLGVFFWHPLGCLDIFLPQFTIIESNRANPEEGAPRRGCAKKMSEIGVLH